MNKSALIIKFSLLVICALFLSAKSCNSAQNEPNRQDELSRGVNMLPGDDACKTLSPHECAAAGCRSVSAKRYEAGKGCRYSEEPVMCIPAGIGCGDAITYAKDLTGNTWQFGDRCIPEAWQYFQESEADRTATLGPLCH